MSEAVPVKIRFLSWLTQAYLRFVGLTSRIRRFHQEIRQEMESSGQGFIYAFWHGRQVFLVYLHEGDALRPLVSRSRDGELISQVCRRFGLETIRGSSSRGGIEAWHDLRREVERGGRVSLTPDGPRGPLRKVQPGILYLAQKTGRPIVPVAYGARRAWIFKGWDEFVVPKPFNRIAMVYGQPLFIGPSDDLSRRALDLQAALNAVTREADEAVCPSSPAVTGGGSTAINETGSPPAAAGNDDKGGISVPGRWIFCLYNLLLLSALPLIILWVLLRWRRRVFAKGMYRWSERCGRLSPEILERLQAGARWWWVHAVSIGEVKAIETFLRRAPGHAGVRVLLSAVTPEAIGWAAQQRLADIVIAAPFDLPWLVRRVFRRVRPELFISVESEFWPNLLYEAKRSGCRVALVNGRLSQRSFESYRKIPRLIRWLWECFDLWAVRESRDAERFAALGAPSARIQVTGNLKYDLRVDEDGAPLDAPAHAPVIVIGSTREGEESRLLPALAALRRQWPELRVIWAPRHLERVGELEALLASQGVACRRKSQSESGGEGGPRDILWDSMGDLLEAYRQADIAVVGGSFVPKGGQNPIEPAALRRPVVFGPSMDNFHGIAEKLVEQGGARQISLEELESCLADLLRDPQRRRIMGERAWRAVENHQGATDKTLRLLEELLHG